MEAIPPPRRLSECEICRVIPAACGADAVRNTGDMPPEFRALVGLPEDFGRPTRREVHCPICGTRYRFTIETGCMEWDLGLWRRSPRASREGWPPPRYAQLLAALPPDLDSEFPLAREFAASSLAEDFLATRNLRGLKRLLRHPRPDVRQAAWRTCAGFTLGPDTDAHEGTVLALLRARDAALSAGALRCLARSPNHLKQRSAEIAAELATRPLQADGIALLRAILRVDAGLDLAPARPALIRYAARRGLAAQARRAAVGILQESARARPAAVEGTLADLLGAGRAGRHPALTPLLQWLRARHATRRRAQGHEDRAGESWPPR